MATCLCDAFYAEAAQAAVEILEHAGCEVIFPEDQTCCGQPPFNSGDFATSRKIARHTLTQFSGDLPIIVPSGSCAAMQQHGNALQFDGETDAAAMADMGRRTWEVTDFIVNGLGLTSWPGHVNKRIALHHSCHTRGSGTARAMELLLGSIEGVTLVPFGQGEQCCGFGGTFSVTFPNISREIGLLKWEHVLQAQPEWLVSGDMSCLMHLSGIGEKNDRSIPVRHVAQILKEALDSAAVSA